MDMNTNRKTGIICIVASILVVIVIFAFRAMVFRWQETSSNIEVLRHNLEVAIDSVRLNPADYYGFSMNILYPDYQHIKERLYMLRYFDKDSTKRFYTGYGINERTMQIVLGPEINDMDSQNEIASINEKDKHMQAILMQLLQFRKIAGIGTITWLFGSVDIPKIDKGNDLSFVFWYKRNCYQLTHYTDHEFSPTDTVVHGDWQLRKVEPLPW